MSLTYYKLQSFCEFMKRIAHQYSFQIERKQIQTSLKTNLKNLYKFASEQEDSFKEIYQINEDFPSNKKLEKKESLLSTIIEQSDQNVSENEEVSNSFQIKNILKEISKIIDTFIPGQNKIINQYKLELKSLALQIQDLEKENEDFKNKEAIELQEKIQNENMFKKLYWEENKKMNKLNTKFENLQEEINKLKNFIQILESDKEKLNKELEKERKNSARIHSSNSKRENQEKQRILEENNTNTDKILIEKENTISELQSKLKNQLKNLTKTRSDSAILLETKNSLENEIKILKNINSRLEKELEKSKENSEKNEKYIKELLIRLEDAKSIDSLNLINKKQANQEKDRILIDMKQKDQEILNLKENINDIENHNKQFEQISKLKEMELKQNISVLNYEKNEKELEIQNYKNILIEKQKEFNFLLEKERQRIRELDENLLKLIKDFKNKDDENKELKKIMSNYSEIGRDFKEIRKKLLS